MSPSAERNSYNSRLTGCDLPTSPPASPHLATSPVSSSHHHPHRPYGRYQWEFLDIIPGSLVLSSSPMMDSADVDHQKLSSVADHAAVFQMTSSTARLDQDPGAERGGSPSLSVHLPSREVSSSSIYPRPIHLRPCSSNLVVNQ